MAVSRIRFITFDVTGTLLKFRKPPIEFYKEAGRKHGVIIEDKEKLAKAFSQTWKRLNEESPHFGVRWETWWMRAVVQTFRGSSAVLAGTYKPPPESVLLDIAKDLIDEFSTANFWEVKRGAVDLLDALKSHASLKVGIISNFDPRLHQLLTESNIRKYFDLVMTSHEYQVSKPDIKMFQIALEEIGGNLSPDQALHVGDNYELDYVGARRAGWHSILVGGKEEIVASARVKMGETEAMFLQDVSFLNLANLRELLNHFYKEGLLLKDSDQFGVGTPKSKSGSKDS